MINKVDFFWDVGSTNSYFALKLLKPMAAKHGVEIAYRPLNLGYVFRHHNYVLMEEPKAKIDNRLIDLMRWARKYDLPFKVPSVFPIKTSRALRGSIAMRRWRLEAAYVEAIFDAYWEGGDVEIGEYSSLRLIAAHLGVDPDEFETQAEGEAVRAAIIAETEDALAEGIFGAPIIRVEDQLYWGKDRMEFVEAHLAGRPV